MLMVSLWTRPMSPMLSLKSSPRLLVMSLWPSETPVPKTFREHLLKTWLQVRLFLLRLIIPSLSITTFNGGHMFPALTGGIHWDQRATSRARETILSSTSRMKTLRRTQSGPANACLRKPSGSLRLVADLPAGLMSGAMTFVPMANGWLTLTRGISRTKIPAKTATSDLLLWRSFLPTDMDSTIWRATCGSGPVTGIARTTTRSSKPAAQRATRRDRILRMIRLNLARPRKCIAEVHSCEPISIARATWSAHEAKGILIRERIILAFVV